LASAHPGFFRPIPFLFLIGSGRPGEFPDYVIEGASEILMHKRLDRP